MTTQRNPLRWAFGLLVVMCATVAFIVPTAPVAHADPQGDAMIAIDQAWAGAGGDTSPLGPKVGGVYPAGTGFGHDFVNGAIFFSPETGARAVFGAILEKYRSLGGPADSGLGFPSIDEGPGRAPESRNVTFSTPEGAVIFWTPATGAWLVRGLINAAWDKVGGSSGPLGVPVEDETYSGESISQRFSGGQLTYDTAARTFTTTPPELAGQLADLPLPDDAASSIDLAWRVAGGAGGQLGAKQGDSYAVGDGTGQDFAGGKIYFSPDTGAHVVSGAILEKYEAAGGPAGDLGFPTANEVDGDIPGSRVSTFADEAAIVWTAEHGAVVVRGPMKAAWDELGGSGGDLGVPIADQTGEDNVTQNFSGGQVTYNAGNNTFSTQPPELAERLAGLDLPQQSTPTPSTSAAPAAQGDDNGSDGGRAWKSWYLWVLIPLVVLVLASLAALLMMRRRRGREQLSPMDTGPYGGALPAGGRDDFDHTPYGARDDDDDRTTWISPGAGQGSGPTEHDAPERDTAGGDVALGATDRDAMDRDSTDRDSTDRGAADRDDADYLASQPPWAKREQSVAPWGEPVVPTGGMAVTAAGPELFTHHGAHEADDFSADIDEQDPDDVDTAPTRVLSEDEEPSGRHAAASEDDSRPPWLVDDDAHVPGPNSLFAPAYGAVPPPSEGEAEEPVEADAYEADAYEVPDEYEQSNHAEPAREQPDYAGSEYQQSDYQQSDYVQSDYVQPSYSEPTYSPQDDFSQPEEDHSTDYAGSAGASGPEGASGSEGASASQGASAPPPAIHLPLEDPDEAPEGYPIKGSMRTGTYHSPGSASFDVTVAEIWFASEELAESNGFSRAE
jgi:uncharacterized protein with LGFP repeats